MLLHMSFLSPFGEILVLCESKSLSNCPSLSEFIAIDTSFLVCTCPSVIIAIDTCKFVSSHIRICVTGIVRLCKLHVGLVL